MAWFAMRMLGRRADAMGAISHAVCSETNSLCFSRKRCGLQKGSKLSLRAWELRAFKQFVTVLWAHFCGSEGELPGTQRKPSVALELRSRGRIRALSFHPFLVLQEVLIFSSSPKHDSQPFWGCVLLMWSQLVIAPASLCPHCRFCYHSGPGRLLQSTLCCFFFFPTQTSLDEKTALPDTGVTTCPGLCRRAYLKCFCPLQCACLWHAAL